MMPRVLTPLRLASLYRHSEHQPKEQNRQQLDNEIVLHCNYRRSHPYFTIAK
jgi:hypothetical protein